MSIRVRPIKALNDNYIWMLDRPDSREVCVVDPGDADPVLRLLNAEDRLLSAILLTHHHWDHVDGVKRLLESFPAPVYGPISAAIDSITHPLGEGDSIQLLQRRFDVLTVPGHTLDHIAFFAPSAEASDEGLLFCGDTLFAGGCGRLFEGAAEVMYHSLMKLAGLPHTTLVYCAHEYTVSNLRFARVVEPANKAMEERLASVEALRRDGKPTLPSTIKMELRTNPFLRCHIHVAERVLATDEVAHPHKEVATFAALRRWKDNFRA